VYRRSLAVLGRGEPQLDSAHALYYGEGDQVIPSQLWRMSRDKFKLARLIALTHVATWRVPAASQVDDQNLAVLARRLALHSPQFPGRLEDKVGSRVLG
jgi:hypothetical protein